MHVNGRRDPDPPTRDATSAPATPPTSIIRIPGTLERCLGNRAQMISGGLESAQEASDVAGPKDPKQDGQVLTRKKSKTKKPRMYKVLLHNDDYTPMEFVVAVLTHIFRLGEVDATRIMLHVHNSGVGIAGVFTHEIAETKMQQVLANARRQEYPLQCSIEPE